MPVEKWVEKVEDTGQKLLDNPLPVLETAALTYVGVPPEIASAAVTAANGGSVQNVAAAYVGSVAGQAAGAATGTELASQGYDPSTVNIASSAVGASASATTKALANGQSLEDSLKAGVQSGVVGGLATAGTEVVKSAVETPIAGTGLKSIQGEGTTLFAPDQGGTGLTSNVPTEGGQGLYGDPNSILPSSLAQYATAPSQQKAGASGQLVPRYTAGQDSITPTGMEKYSTSETTPTKTGPAMTESLSPEASKTLQAGLGIGLSGIFAPSGTTKRTPDTSTLISGTSGTTPGSQALGQALRVGDAGVPVFGGDKEEGKKSGWNVESLRYMGQES
jgi:hypothetical protein